MRNSIKIQSALTALLFIVGQVRAQNIPVDNATVPGGTSTAITATKAFDQGGNTAPAKFNYVRSWTPLVPVSDTSGFTLVTGYALGTSTVQVATLYTNGWGDPLLQLTHRTDNLHDLATVYDNRVSMTNIDLLKFPTDYANSHFELDPFTNQKNYYSNLYPSEDGIAYNLKKTEFVNGISINSSYTAGKSFAGQGRGSTTRGLLNNSSDSIRIWIINAAGVPVTSSVYADNTLTKKITEGQHGQQTIQFIDQDGQCVCTKTYSGNNVWLSSYSVYDDFGKLKCYLPPKAVTAIAANNWQVSSSIMSGLCYTYTYDKNGRVIQRTVPDKNGADYFVFDKQERCVLYQSPLMRQQGKWQFTIYDQQSRPVMTGFTSSSNSLSAWQNLVTTTNPQPGSLLDFLINGFNGSYPNSYTAIANTEIWEFYYYDTYDQDVNLSGRAFDYSYASAYLTGNKFLTPQPSLNTYGRVTGKKTFIPGSTTLPNSWVNSVFFYDQYGNIIQTHILNPFSTSGQWDILTTQFTFAGQPALVIDDHKSWSTANKQSTKIYKWYDYDLSAGKLKEIKQKTDSDPNWHSIVTFTYDALGRVSEKKLGGVEHQVLGYNIRGQITDLNKDFVNYPNSSQTQDMTFGMSLSYDYGFSNPRYDGLISGFIWRGSGNHSPKRAYGYSYDEAAKLTSADFREYTMLNGNPLNSAWNNSQTDYGVSKLTYDDNGNILSLKQRGVDISGTNTPVDIDDLSYNYLPNSNHLDRVEDAVSANYHLSDFVNNNLGTTDYSYDADGNLVGDANKGISNISYNFLDRPTTITTNSGTVTSVYDASGKLLQKTITPTSGPSQTYKYWGDFTYRNDSLLYFTHEEGRTRWLADSNKFKYDFFIKDHLGNVRTTVTADEGGTKEYLATYEVAAANTENLMFEGVDEHRAPKPGSTNSSDVRAALLNGEEPSKRIGTALLLKVMAGDKFNASAFHYYDNSPDDNVSASSEDMLGSIVDALSNSASPVGGEGSAGSIVGKLFTPDNYTNIYDGIKEQATDPQLPRAYLNYIVFDENMRIVPDQSGALQVSNASSSWQQISLPSEITVGQNGYVAVYISNEEHKDIFFDYLSISHFRGRLLEENHYYPHGLTIKAGSNTPLANKYLYQSKILQDDLNINLYDFQARQYDPQIGRFCSVDPADQFASGYIGMANDPANYTDPTGAQANKTTGSTSLSPQLAGSSLDPNNNPVGWSTNMDSWTDYLPAGWDKPSVGKGNVVVLYASDMSYSTEEKVKTSTRWTSRGFGYWIESYDKNLSFGYYKPIKDVPNEKGQLERYGVFFGSEGPISKWADVQAFGKRFNFRNYPYDQFNDQPFGTFDYEWYFIPLPPIFKGIGYGAKALEVAEGAEIKVMERALWCGGGKAENAAMERGYQVLGRTRAGINLGKLTAGMEYKFGSRAYLMWARLSQVFVRGIPDGSVVQVFVTRKGLANAESIFLNYEKPILDARGIKYVFNIID